MAIELIYTLHQRAEIINRGIRESCHRYIFRFNHLMLAWGTFIAPILESLTRQSINPCREVRTSALSLLQRLLLLPDLLPPKSPDTAYWPDSCF